MSVKKMDLFHKDFEIRETNFDDGSFWVCYKDSTGSRGYELVKPDKIRVDSLDSSYLMRDLEFCDDSIVYLYETEIQDFNFVKESLMDDVSANPELKEFIDFIDVPGNSSINIDMQILTKLLF